MLKDPVSTSCGHNYCRGCINEFWDNCAGDYVCPQCENTSETRPVLNTNAALAEVVKSLHHDFSPALPPQSYAGLEDVACDFCTEQHKLKAVKCCLTCDVFLCETHVKPHYTIAALQKHTLSDVTGDMKTRPEQHQNTDNSFSSTVSGQQDQTDKTQDVIEVWYYLTIMWYTKKQASLVRLCQLYFNIKLICVKKKTKSINISKNFKHHNKI